MHGSSSPAWLRQVLRDKSLGPKIYRWTIDDILHSKAAGACQAAELGNDGAAAEYKPTLQVNSELPRIYILGLGNLGRLFASSLAQLPNRPPITLIVHRKSLLEYWHAKPGIILHSYCPSNPGDHGTAGTTPLVDFDVEMWSEEPPPWPQERREIASNARDAPSHIQNLIVATKAQDSLAEVDWLRRYLGPESTVMFAQNGMNKLWPPHGTVYNGARYCHKHQGQQSLHNPLWLACTVTHGVVSLGPFESMHASPAGVVVGAVNTSHASHSSQNPSQSYLVKQLVAAPRLNARYAQRPELWILQLEKVVVNSIINPLTAILRCKNGDIFSGTDDNKIVGRIIDELLEEASSVIRCLVQYDEDSREILEDASLNSSPSASQVLVERLSVFSLRRMLYNVGGIVKDNTSSMLQDIRLGRTTEIRQFNGWIVETASHLRSLGAPEDIDVTFHAALIGLVESGASLTREQLGEFFSLR